MSNKKLRVYCSGPLFCPEELATMRSISNVLEKSGYETFLPQRDGVEAFVMNSVDGVIANAWLARPFNRIVNRAVFSLDVYEIIERCEAFVFNMNGRVPDEGGVVELAMAYATGKPIVIYKNDVRSLACGQDAPMLTGVTGHRACEIAAIPALLAEAIRQTPPPTDLKLPSKVAKVVRHGRLVRKLLDPVQFMRPRNNLLKWWGK